MITELTKEQESKFPVYTDKWKKIGLKFGETTKTEMQEAVAIVEKIYEISCLAKPKVEWCDSPFQAIEKFKINDTDAARYLQGNAGWFGFLDFMKTELGLDKETKNNIEGELAKLCLMCFYYDEVCILIKRPLEINLNKRNDPHSYTRPAILFADKKCLCYFNNIKVPMALVKAKTFTKKEILSQDNVDIRREMIAKIGIVEAEKIMGAIVIDELNTIYGGKYQLLHIDYNDSGVKRPYLKMINPSLKGVVHIEGVESSKTVREAIMYRWKLKSMPDDEMIASVT